MCLSVYLGTKHPVTAPEAALGALGIQPAGWTLPPLRRYEHVYNVGTRAGDGTMRCACALSESVSWSEQGPEIHGEDLADGERDPFDVLRALCDEATRDGWSATLVCDDGGENDPDCTSNDYADGYVRLHHITRGSLIFADAVSFFPWRSLTIVR